MNRQQRRHPPKYQKPKYKKQKKPQLRDQPTFALLAVMNEILEALQERGLKVRDWDHKDKVVRKMSSIGGKLYMLATTENTEANTHGEENNRGEEQGR